MAQGALIFDQRFVLTQVGFFVLFFKELCSVFCLFVLMGFVVVVVFSWGGVLLLFLWKHFFFWVGGGGGQHGVLLYKMWC